MTFGYHNDTTGPFTFEWNDPVARIVIPVTVLIMQVINPLIIYCIICCVSCGRDNMMEQEEDVELQNLQRNYQTSLDIFRQDHPRPEEELNVVAASQFIRMHDDYQRQSNEITERKEARVQKNIEKVKFCRIFSLYAYITFWIYLLYVILRSTTQIFGGSVFEILFIISTILVFVTYFIVLLECFSSSERQYIRNLSSSVFAVERIETIRATQPSIFFRVECYHYETRTRTVTYRDANGDLQTRLETYQEKVVTNLFLQPVSFQYWRDTSPPVLVGINNKGITKIKMTLSVEPGDEETAAAISEQYTAFQNKYRHSDVFVDFSIEKRVQGFEKRLAAYTDNREKPIWVSNDLFIVATFLCLSWPYRWAFKLITSKTKFAVQQTRLHPSSGTRLQRPWCKFLCSN